MYKLGSDSKYRFFKKGLITDEAKKHIGKLVNMDIGIVAKEES